MHFICRSFIGKHNSNSWAQFWENESDDYSVSSKKGHIFGLLNISTPEIDKEIIKTGKSVIAEINQFYYSSPHDQVSLSLKYCLESIKNSPSSDIITDLVLVIIHQDTLYSGVFKSGTCTLSRGQQISRLLDANDNETSQISGQIIAGDKILLATQPFFKKIFWEKIKSIISDTKIQNIEENFLSELYSLDDQSGVSAVTIQLSSDHDGVATTVPTPQENPPPAEIKTPPGPSRLNKSNIFKKIFSQKPTFIAARPNTPTGERRIKINNIVAVVILIALAIGSYFGYVQNHQKNQEAEYQKLKTEIESKIADSRTVKNLNLEDAIKLARDAQAVLDKISALKIHADQVETYKQQITQILSQSGSASDYQPEFFTDTGVIVDKPQYSRMVLIQNSLLVIDSSSNRVDSIDIAEKNNYLFSQDENIGKSLSFATSSDKLYSLTETGVFQVSKSSSKEVLSFSKLEKPPKPVDLYFWTNSLYLLDPANSAIWKSAPNDSGFSSPEAWLKDGQPLTDNASNLSINGKIWVLSSSGNLTAYTRGVKENFSLQSVSPLVKTDHLNVGADSEIIVFSDNENIVYLYDKTGKYQSSYNYGDLKILDLVYYEKNNQIFILASDQKIYKISL